MSKINRETMFEGKQELPPICKGGWPSLGRISAQFKAADPANSGDSSSSFPEATFLPFESLFDFLS